MKKCNLITCILILALCSAIKSFAQQPVNITSADVPSAVGTIYTEKAFKGASIAVNLGTAGENQVWDFTDIIPNLTFTRTWEVIAKESSPFSSDFPDANLVYKVTASNSDTVDYNYVKLTDTDLSELGQGKQVSGATILLVTSYEADPKTNFPVTYGDAPWLSVPKYETTYEIIPGMPITVIAVDSNRYTIDGWGTVKTPLGNIPCIRVKQYHVLNVYLKDSGQLLLPEYEKNIIYIWVAPIYGFVVTVRSTYGETNDNFTEAKEVKVTNYFPTVVDNFISSIGARDYVLFQNYPNPFNPVTKISYELPKPEYVKIKIFNAKGQQVTTLINEKQQTGRHLVQWDASDKPSGIYFYQLQLNNLIMQKKCLLIK